MKCFLDNDLSQISQCAKIICERLGQNWLEKKKRWELSPQEDSSDKEDVGPHGASARLLPVLPSWAVYPAQASQLRGLAFFLHIDVRQATNSTVCVWWKRRERSGGEGREGEERGGRGEGRRGRRPEKGGEEEVGGGGWRGREGMCSTLRVPSPRSVPTKEQTLASISLLAENGSPLGTLMASLVLPLLSRSEGRKSLAG